MLSFRRILAAAGACAVLSVSGGAAYGMPSAGAGGADSSAGRVRASLEQGALKEVLEAKGLSADEVRTRLDRLDPRTLRQIAENADRIEEGGIIPLIIAGIVLIIIAIVVGLQELHIID